MNGTFFYIGLGGGLALACGVRPFLPLLTAGALASAGVLGVSFTGAPFHFLASGWWLLACVAALLGAYSLQLALGAASSPAPGARPREGALAAALGGLGLGAGALLFAGTLAAHGDSWWPGLLGGLAAAALAQRASAPVLAGARARLADRAAREALSVYLDAVSLVLAAAVALLHPLGYVVVALFAWFALRRRARRDDKHAGLRVLRG
jgi:hypothetical protein